MIEFTNVATRDTDCPELVDGLQRRDAGLWSSGLQRQREVENRLGWVDAARFMDLNQSRILDFAARAREQGYRQVVVLGMGGSSLAPRVYAKLLGDGAVSLTVLDSTAPRQVQHVAALCRRAKTLFIVSSKSGTTAETGALEAYFFERQQGPGERPGESFVAITDPGSPLQALAAHRAYRQTFLNPEDIGGRFSALSFFGLVPAALIGADLSALRRHVPASSEASPLMLEACRLGTALGSLARAGRNKLTLRFSPSLAPLAAWIEQLMDESTGKNGQGIVVIAGEARLAPRQYSKDRIFVVIDRPEEPAEDGWVHDLADLGHPIVRWRLDELHHLGAEFYRWETATALAGRQLGINPFDEPDVNDSKAATRAFLEQPDGGPARSPQSPEALARLLEQARHGDYLAVLAYLPASPTNRSRLEQWITRLGRHTGLPCCLGFGPSYLHSSGQLHKGGPDQGIFIVLTLASDFDLPIPGRPYGFKSLIEAQAAGDIRVLRARGRRVAHLEVDEGDGLQALVRSVPGG